MSAHTKEELENMLEDVVNELTKARLDVERMNWIEKHSTKIFCFENVAGNVERYEVASCRAMIDREISKQNDQTRRSDEQPTKQ